MKVRIRLRVPRWLRRLDPLERRLTDEVAPGTPLTVLEKLAVLVRLWSLLEAADPVEISPLDVALVTASRYVSPGEPEDVRLALAAGQLVIVKHGGQAVEVWML